MSTTPWAHHSKAVKNICIEEKSILRSTLNPGLALTAFRTTWHYKNTLQNNPKPVLGQRSTSKKHKSSMSSKLEPAIWSHDTGQRIPCFGRCQLTIAWMFNIKDTRCKARLQDLVLTRVRPPCCATSLLGERAREPYLPWEKSCTGFYFYVCMWSCSYSYGAPLVGPAGAPLINFFRIFETRNIKTRKNWPIFSSFDPLSSMPSVATGDRKQFQYLEIVFNNKTRSFYRGGSGSGNFWKGGGVGGGLYTIDVTYTIDVGCGRRMTAPFLWRDLFNLIPRTPSQGKGPGNEVGDLLRGCGAMCPLPFPPPKKNVSDFSLCNAVSSIPETWKAL